MRIEVKSMNLEAEESKAHFDILHKEVGEYDLLLVIIWKWKKISDKHFAPQIVDHYIDTVIPLIKLRDELHLKRGGKFVEIGNCPDGCDIENCSHTGEPLNAAGKRERITGPAATRPSLKVSYSANFGGLIRMLKTSSKEAFNTFKDIRRQNIVADKYISFIHKQYPNEELNQYDRSSFEKIAKANNIDVKGKSKKDILFILRELDPSYMTKLKDLD